MLVIKRFRERKNIFRDRKLSENFGAKRYDFLLGIEQYLLVRRPNGHWGRSWRSQIYLGAARPIRGPPSRLRSCLGGTSYIRDVVKQRVQRLRRVFDGAFGGVGDVEVVVGEGVAVTSLSLEVLTNSCLGVEFMVEWFEEDEDDKKSRNDGLFN
ncbi:hypothetical protein Tco_1426162 [Tanacetum coccineum]